MGAGAKFNIPRPTENAAIGAATKRPLPVPSADHLQELLALAYATDDRFGARHFGCLLDRALGGAG